MYQEQRNGRLVAGPDVEEVDVLPFDRCGELLVAVQAGLVNPPIVGVQPVADDLLEVAEGNALLPADARDLARKPGPSQAFGQVGKDVVRHVDPERFEIRHAEDATPWQPICMTGQSNGGVAKLAFGGQLGERQSLAEGVLEAV